MSLIDSLVSYWKLDEASGNALDAHGSNELTETSGTIDSATGKINNGRDFESGDTEYFYDDDNASLSTGDIDFSLSIWVKLESKSANGHLIGKYTGATDNREYRLVYASGADRFLFQASSAGTVGTTTSATANTFGSPSTGVWYHVVGWHDAVNNLIGIAVNAGTADTAAYSAGVFDGASRFTIGALGDGSGDYVDGVLDEAGFWKKVLSSDERTQLYNSGNGLAYPLTSTAVIGRGLTHSKLLGRLSLVG